MGDASDIIECDRRTLELSNAALLMKQDTTSIEKLPFESQTSNLDLPAHGEDTPHLVRPCGAVCCVELVQSVERETAALWEPPYKDLIELGLYLFEQRGGRLKGKC